MRWPDFLGSVRAKLVLIVLLPPLVMVPALAGLLFYWGDAAYDKLLVSRVSAELITAHQYLDRVLDTNGRAVAGFADSARLARAMSGDGLRELLQQTATNERFDFVRLLDAEGRIVAGSGEVPVGRKEDWPVVREALNGRKSVAIDIFSAAQLAEISPALAQRARVPLVPTPNAAPDPRSEETQGMLIHAAAPVWNAEGHLAGVVVAGVMLNHNLDFVDTINDIVYPEGSLPLGSKGTATLFLGDVRIATNVRLFGGDRGESGTRALGTRVSQKVRDAVLGEGRTWLDSAFVVNDWYVSGYEPVLDGAGRRVGMLYVGYLETPFARVKYTIFATLIGLFAAVMAASSALLLWRARRVFKPLETMDTTMAAVEAGDVTARVGAVPGRDEIARLAEHFDRLLDTLHERNAELSRLNTELDFKVIERTRELALALEELRAAQKQLVRSEKLAAIGQLTAGVAHEINNPIAVMQGNLDLVREELGEAAAPVKNELRLLDEQIHRVRVIVTKLLQFARPDEFAGYVETVDVNAAVADCLVLVRHELKKGDIAVVQELRATRPVRVNRNELQQVLINLAVNAIHAMTAGGRLTFVTADWEGKGVCIGVRDTGAGIPPEHLARVFDPFFTTKKTQGTGLGLSISLALIERYGGTISVDSRLGAGTEFSVFLLAEPVFREQEGLDTIENT
ncbi:MAG: two-component sensor histidine kinase [Rhodocyclales bacterium]|jgi:two-component system NtrC family sensor kinase|nr:cache domain-containing protein [Rhodocyclaceae bacterium]PWB40173.1 MAG: two-component sensor histidine kinase [Rhodocyclales bacterium]